MIGGVCVPPTFISACVAVVRSIITVLCSNREGEARTKIDDQDME